MLIALVALIALSAGVGVAVYMQRDAVETVNSAETVPKWVSSCVHAGEEQETKCFSSYLVGVQRTLGVDRALDELEAELERPTAANDRVRSRCHEIAHVLGADQARRTGAQAALVSARASCGAGYIHGVFTVLFAQYPGAELATQAADVCADLVSRYSDVNAGVNSCRHALGHELFRRAELELTDGPGLARAAEACLVPARGYTLEGARDECLHGLYMEDALQLAASRTDPSGLCTEAFVLQDSVGLACITEVTLPLYTSSAYDFRGAFSTCLEMIPRGISVEQQSRELCADGMSRAAAAFDGGDQTAVLERCSGLDDLRAACLIGVATMFGQEDLSGARSREYCSKLGDLEQECLERAYDQIAAIVAVDKSQGTEP